MARVGFDPSVVNDAAATVFVVGQVYEHLGKKYRYVQVVDAVAVGNGTVVEWANTTSTAVTSDRAGGSSVGRRVAGVAVGTISQNQYGFIQTGGNHAAVRTDGGVVVTDFLISDTVDQDSDTMAAGEEHLVFAEALATDTVGNTVAAHLFCE